MKIKTNPPSKTNPSYEHFVMRTHNSLLRAPRRRHNPYPITIYTADKTDRFTENCILLAGVVFALLLVMVAAFSFWS